MAPIFIAAKTNNPQTVPIFFTNQGLSGFAPTTISALAIFGKPKYKEVAYDGYYMNIDSFIYATSIQKRVFCEAQGYSTFVPRGLLPLSIPLLQFITAVVLRPEEEDNLVKKFGEGAWKKKSGKTTVYSIPGCNQTILTKIKKGANEIYNAGSDAVNPAGLQAYYFLTGVIYEFLATNTYAAFHNEDDPMRVPGIELAFRDSDDLILYEGAEKRKVTLYSANAKRRKMELEEGHVEHEDATMEDEIGAEGETDDSYRITHLGDAVITAKASPGKAENNFGSANELPEMPGLAFPYFKGLNVPDAANMKTIATDHFFRLIGADHEECKKNIADLRRGLNSLATTDVGMEINHVLMGIRLCLQTQTRLFVVVEDLIYRGFVLLGYNFSIFDGSAWVSPVNPAQLQEDCRRLNPHKDSVIQLVGLLNDMKIVGSTELKRDIVAEDFNTSNNAIRAILSREIADDDLVKANRLVRKLNYRKDGFWGMTPGNIRLLMDHLAGESFPPDTVPQFIPSASKSLASRELRWFMAFGPDAPSFWNNRGEEVKLVKEREITEEDKNTGEKRKITTDATPPEIYVTPKPVEVAARDWEKVMRAGAISQDYKERAKGYRNILIKDETNRRVLWNKLMECSAQVLGVQDAVKKAKILPDAVIKTGADFLDLF